MTTTSDKITTFKFKVGDDLQVINKVISVLGLAPSNYIYNAKEGTITTSKTSKESIEQQVKGLGFDFLLGSDTSNKNYETKTVTVTKPYINTNSIGIAIDALYKQYKQVLGLVSSNIDYVAKTVTVTANVRTPTFNELDYKVALILTNFSYITTTNNTTSSTEQEAYDKLYESIDKLIDRVSSDFDKSAPKELKTLISLFL